eukprot:m.239834 g.239834  ORF g.239834 m.239834 type:complete len:729 (-) comp16073_c1_seq1:663-2849(-)
MMHWRQLSVLTLLCLHAHVGEGQDSVSAKAWATGGVGKLVFPEFEEPNVQAKTNSAICFPGGGTRAFTSATGVIRILHKLGLMDHIRYISAVSGGSWAASAYTFRNSPMSDDDFLGEYLTPGSLTPEVLNTMPKLGSLPSLAAQMTAKAQVGGFDQEDVDYEKIIIDLLKGRDVVDIEFAALLKIAQGDTKIGNDVLKALINLLHLDPARLWPDVIQQYFFNPVGIDNVSYVALNSDQIADIKARNSNLQNAKFVIPTDDKAAPFLVMAGSIVGPKSLAPLVPNTQLDSLTRLEITPMYIGSDFKRSVVYEGQSGSNLTEDLGGYVETFAFGSSATTPVPATSDSKPILLDLPEPSPFRVGDMAAISSMFFGNAFASMEEPVPETVASYPILPIQEGGTPTTMLLADGGVLEDTGVISMVLRKVEHIVVFDCSQRTLETDDDLRSLFGIFGNQSKSNYMSQDLDLSKNQIFSNKSFFSFYGGLQAQAKAGKPVIYASYLKTVANDWWGVPKDQEVHLTWMYYKPPKEWVDQLPQATQTLLKSSSKFTNFPLYETINEFFLDQQQTNLLSQLTSYITMSFKDQLNVSLGIYPATTTKATTTGTTAATKEAGVVTTAPSGGSPSAVNVTQTGKKKRDMTALIVGVVIAGLMFCVCVVYVLTMLNHKDKDKGRYENLSEDELQYAGAVDNPMYAPSTLQDDLNVPNQDTSYLDINPEDKEGYLDISPKPEV